MGMAALPASCEAIRLLGWVDAPRELRFVTILEDGVIAFDGVFADKWVRLFRQLGRHFRRDARRIGPVARSVGMRWRRRRVHHAPGLQPLVHIDVPERGG